MKKKKEIRYKLYSWCEKDGYNEAELKKRISDFNQWIYDGIYEDAVLDVIVDEDKDCYIFYVKAFRFETDEEEMARENGEREESSDPQWEGNL